MGLFDKLKAVGNYITGGGAEVTLEVGEARLGEPIAVTVRARVKDAAMKVNKVYVTVEGVEEVRGKGSEVDAKDPNRSFRLTSSTFSQEFLVHGPVELAANSSHEWQGQVTLPTSVAPTYQGARAKHVWTFTAGLDVPGNDPDSGSIEVYLR